jgi:hypothetical protein
MEPTMSVRHSPSVLHARRTRAATVLAGLTAATLTGAVLAAGGATAGPTAASDGASPVAESTGEPPRGDSLPDRVASGVDWPTELTEHTRLFVNPYRSYLVEIRNGAPTLVLSTGWDSCWFMTQNHGVRNYPC